MCFKEWCSWIFTWCPMQSDTSRGEDHRSLVQEERTTTYRSTGETKTSQPDLDNSPNRAFVLARHEKHGYLILKAFKKRKGLHGQLPGGKIDCTDPSPAFAAAREFFEETGIDVRNRLERLKLAKFPDGKDVFKKRQYFRLILSDQDACGDRKPDSGEDFSLHLSSEHVGYVFQKDPLQAAEAVVLHSGGKNHTAMLHLECA